ncbi:uncharacterized protein LOC129718265 [Wyeomyia smithii]|uniref:uncharacterized protein LOC129718265 n=1 Tax=Wyeomyia smithii TaxID=174621 RepID=UPI002467DD4E|nr:uncharacterized protein LOC129718265 [Wyeomyia smithii]
MRAILDPLAVSLGTTFTSASIKAKINLASDKIKQYITREMKGKLISLKIDSASRHGRHILGINAQFVSGDEVVIRTLRMVELNDKQTGKFLKTKILETLQMYKIELNNVYSITCDNGANMCAAVKDLQNEFELQKMEDFDINFDNDDVDDNILHNIMHELKDSVNLVRCAVHTLQLAVTDVTKRYEDGIRLVTTVAKNCRKSSYKVYFEKENQALPPLYAKTRWGGTFKMLAHFKNSEEYYTTLGAKHGELDLKDRWDFIDSFVEAFQPVYDCTISLQNQHVGLSDFYMQWINAIKK